MNKLYVTILAGGMGKRMQSHLPKVLVMVKGESMIVRLLKQIILLNPAKIFVVVGKFHIMIQNEIEKNITDDRIFYINQEMPLGTGDAVKSTLPQLVNDKESFSDEHLIQNIILNGDVPLIQYSTIKEIYDYYVENESNFLITSINLKNPSGNGRIIIDSDNNFKEIVEEKDCNVEQKLITLVNCGIYICNSDVLTQYIPLIKSNNSQGEYYLTDLVKIYRNATNQKIDLFILSAEKEIEIYNINTKEQLEYLENY